MKSRMVLVAFLLMLYIGPMVFISSYASPAIPTEPNMNKEFQISSSGDWLDGWTYRKLVSITGSNGAGANYSVLLNVTYDSDMKSDFSDIRFTDNDKLTELDYWIELYVVSTYADVWIQFTDNLDTNQTGYMYYGNTTVSTTSNGTNTFIFFDDFENNNLNRWDTAEANWATGQEPTPELHGYVAFGDADATGRILNKDFSPSLTTDFMIHAWVRTKIDTGTEFPMYGYDDGADDVYFVATRADDHSTYNGAAWVTYDETTAIDETWIRTELAVDYTNDLFRLWLDRASASDTRPNKDDTGSTITGVSDIGSITSTVEGSDSWLDDYYVRAWILVEPELDSFGEEEEYVAPAWTLVNEVEVIFYISVDETGFNMFLIFLGLFMIPVSMIYLVHGGKDELNTNKVFYFLLAFAIGWGLFLGGIM